MTKTEKENLTRLESNYARQVLKNDSLVEENSILKRQLEIICERYKISDDEQNEIRIAAVKGN